MKNTQRKIFPAIVDLTVRKKRTNEQAGIRWDRVVENLWREIRGNQNEIMSIDDGGGYKTKLRHMVEKRWKETLKRNVDGEEHLKIYGGLREGIGMETYLLGPME